MITLVESLCSREQESKRFTGPALVIRHIGDQGGMLQASVCEPGIVSVLSAGKTPLVGKLRSFLKGDVSVQNLQLRIGPHVLDVSEIYVGTETAVLWKHMEVSQALLANGVPSQLQEALLVFAGIEPEGGLRIQDLSSPLLRRLAILSAFFSKGRVLVFDDPFKDEDKAWSTMLAQLMLGVTRSGRRIVLVLLPEKSPRGIESLLNPGLDELPEEFGAPLGRLRTLLSENGAREVESVFLTRPQRLRLKPRGQEGMGFERISNPVVEGSSLSVEEKKLNPTVIEATKKPAKQRGVLTAVRWQDRAKRLVLGAPSVKKTTKAPAAVDTGRTLPKEVSLREVRKKVVVRKVVFSIISLAFVFLVFFVLRGL